MTKSGEERVYESVLLRRTFREGGKVRHETLANLKALPEASIAAIEATLRGQTLVPAAEAATLLRSLPHGHVAAVWAQAKVLGLPAMLGPAGRMRDLAMALILARAVAPASKLATASWWADTTLGVDLGVTGAGTDEIYAAMDWLTGRQDRIEKQLAGKHLATVVNPSRIAMFDLSSSWVTGRHCDLAARGYSRDGKKGCEQIEYGLLTDPAGRPVAVRVFPGNTADPAAFTHAVTAVKDTFALENMLMVGDRGMITSARITALQQVGGLGWLTALRAPQIAALAADDGPLQMSLFDEQNFAEITHPDYPGERLIVCRNPALADERARKRGELLDATEAELGKIVAAVTAGRLSGAGKIGLRVGKVLGKYKVGKHFRLDITDTSLMVTRNRERIDAEAALDGIYTLRTTASADELGTAAVIDAYKNLSRVERDFRSLKAIDIDLRPIHHRLTDRVKGHVLICMLAAYLTWHLRRAWAPLTYTDENPPHREDPVAPAARSAAARAKAARKTTTDGDLPARSYQALLAHLATLTRNDLRYGDDGPIVATLAVPTPTQRRAFELLDTTIPHTVR
ncbi:transposase (plasmid) [Rhodococcus opacus]|uniref:Transposase n=1 Tax=Rhodococcus opacus TaxID=37919 RepID=A0A076F0K0_RHOOP|nr:IS1634 family transposase [Rhodococcus opacus]AII06526.1 transposase [Rhodococcus opacus]AII11188.1 transposase [Rhodococcus opacus]UNN04581.1 IS1634 family transposase [Rhodococcus opacus]